MLLPEQLLYVKMNEQSGKPRLLIFCKQISLDGVKKWNVH